MISTMHHVTIQSGHVALQARHEVSDFAVATVGKMFDGILAGKHVPLHACPGYVVSGTRSGSALIATLWHVDKRGRVPVLTTGVALHECDSSRLWDSLFLTGNSLCGTAGPTPPTPWIADRLELGLCSLDLHMSIDLMGWSGDWARTLGWSWAEHVRAETAGRTGSTACADDMAGSVNPISSIKADDETFVITSLAVGRAAPRPLWGEGLRAQIKVADGMPNITLWAGANAPTPSEVEAMQDGKLRLSILPAPPLVWIILDAGGGLSFDAPYAPGLEFDPMDAAGWGKDWTIVQRALVTVPFVNSEDGTIVSLRGVTLSREWVRQLGQAAAKCSIVDGQTVDAAISRDMKRWRSPRSMIRDAKIIELAGR